MRFGVIFGGMSYEHEISVVSAISLTKVLPNLEIFIFLDSHRELYLIPSHEMKSSHFASGAYRKNPKLFLSSQGVVRRGFFGDKPLAFDLLINLVHGGDGEDGKLAAIFEFFQIPFIGPRVEASVMSFNKHFTKLYARERGVETLPYEILSRQEKREIKLPLPLIAKPLRLGSSIGVGVVKHEDSLEYALDVAFEFDDTLLLEPFIEGIKEYNLAGCKIGETYHFSIIEEPQKKEFLDFEKKYLDFSRTTKTSQAEITPELERSLKESFVKLYERNFEGSLIRCDFFVMQGRIILNEINPIPGSMANYLFENFSDLINQMAANLPERRLITVDYRYIHQIQQAKGK